MSATDKEKEAERRKHAFMARVQAKTAADYDKKAAQARKRGNSDIAAMHAASAASCRAAAKMHAARAK
jgi:hypothetical protein